MYMYTRGLVRFSNYTGLSRLIGFVPYQTSSKDNEFCFNHFQKPAFQDVFRLNTLGIKCDLADK